MIRSLTASALIIIALKQWLSDERNALLIFKIENDIINMPETNIPERDEHMNIGKNIKQLRQQRNLTQEQIALQLGVSYQAVSKWENDANTPDIELLPKIADLFDVSIDSLFTGSIEDCPDIRSFMKDDDIIRVVQIQRRKVLKISSIISSDEPPIEIAFPRNCNDRTQYFKVEIYGNVVADGSINGDVICHRNIQSSMINGDVKSAGNIDVKELNGQNIICQNITGCYKMEAQRIECNGNISSENLICKHITYDHE